MKYLILLCMLVMILGIRNTHTNQYDLGYQAGLKAAS